MKPQSKQNKYIVECKSTFETESVVRYITGKNQTTGQWNYVINNNLELKDCITMFIHPSNKLPIISFEEWQSLPDFPKPEYDPKDVAFKPIGYKFKDENIRNIVTAFLGSIEAYKTDSYDFPVKSLVYRELKELQVLDLWCDKVLFEKESEFNSSNAFKELKKETDKLLKIVGYKLIKPDYKQAAELIAFNHIQNLTNKSFIYQNGVCFAEDCKVKDNLEEAGVMHWFQLVYDTSITLKSGVKLSEDDIAEVKEILNNK